MPLLNPVTLGNAFASVPRMAAIYRRQLEVSIGASGTLNQSCKLGVDALLKDASGESITESNCPYVRISWDTEGFLVPSVGGVLFATVNLHLFFVMYFGKPGGTVLPVDFVSLREQYIAWNMEYLKERQVGPNAAIGFTAAQQQDDAGQRFWWLSGEQVAPVNHQTPFDIFGFTTPIPVSSGFTVSRVDYVVTVRNHATFNDAFDPSQFDNYMAEFFPGEIPSGAIDGSNVTFVLANAPKVGSNGNTSLTGTLDNTSLIYGQDFTVSGQIVTLSVAPTSGQVLRFTYFK